MSVQTYKKQSDINEKAVDNDGRCALHYLIRALPEASFDNHVLLLQLVAIGVSLDLADNTGKTVLDCALAQRLPKLSTTAQYLADNSTKQFVSLLLTLSDQCMVNLKISNLSLDDRSYFHQFVYESHVCPQILVTGNTRSPVTDDIVWDFLVPDFKSDAEVYLKKFEEECATEEGKDKREYEAKPDEKLEMEGTG